MIHFHAVSRSYGPKLVVDQLTLSVPAGELFALLGPNGAGKTTSIKMLVGLLRPDAGTLEIDGVDVASAARQATARIGYVPDEPFLYEKLSGREFLEFVAELRGLDRATAAERIARETEYFGLDGFLDDLAETYSHGMKQRVAFASILLHDPAVLVLDEPMVGLDPYYARRVKDRLRQRARSGGAVFMSTHMLGLAEEIADRIGIMAGGRIHFLGALADLQRELAAPDTALEPLFLQLTGNGDDPPSAAQAAVS